MSIMPVEWSALTNQRSDLSKVAGDDFLRIQQQQMANLIKKQEEEHKYETKQVESAEDTKIDPESKEKNDYHGEQERSEHEIVAEDDLKPIENVEYVKYQDPDIGNALDWQG